MSIVRFVIVACLGVTWLSCSSAKHELREEVGITEQQAGQIHRMLNHPAWPQGPADFVHLMRSNGLLVEEAEYVKVFDKKLLVVGSRGFHERVTLFLAHLDEAERETIKMLESPSEWGE